MGNILSSHSPANKTAEHDVEASNGTHVLPMDEKPHTMASTTREDCPEDELDFENVKRVNRTTQHRVEDPDVKSSLPFHKPKPKKEVACPDCLKGPFEKEWEKLETELKEKVVEFQDAIQPHTDEGGNALFIGDAYEPVNQTYATEWRVTNPGPYLEYIKSLALLKRWHHLEYLAHWMEVTASPPKWKFLRKGAGLKSREERATRTKVCRIDYTKDQLLGQTMCHDVDSLKTALAVRDEAVQTRLLIVEDLSRDVVETLGAFYDVDPLFFLSHINDYLFHNTRDRWVELPSLDIDARNRSHFNLQYLRPRYFETEDSFKKAELQSGRFNVLRRLDSDRSRTTLQNGLLDQSGASVTLVRAKTSLWIKPRVAGEPVTAILLVDPTVSTGHPLWGGNRPFESTPSMKSRWEQSQDTLQSESGYPSLFEDVIHWSSKLTPEDLAFVDLDPKCIAIPIIKSVILDWLSVLKYMTARLGLIEWEMAKPHWGEHPYQMDDLMKKLAPWRRNIGYYQSMVNEAIVRLFPNTLLTPFDASMTMGSNSNPVPAPVTTGSDSQLLSLWPDFRIVKQQITDCQARIMSIQNTATNAITIEESRRAVKQNKNLARLTFLATMFIPMSFTASFLSMSPDFKNATDTIWLFFVLGIPVTLSALIVVDLTHPNPKKSVCKQAWGRLFSDPEKASPGAEQQPSSVGRVATMLPWPNTRSPSSYLRQRR